MPRTSLMIKSTSQTMKITRSSVVRAMASSVDQESQENFPVLADVAFVAASPSSPYTERPRALRTMWSSRSRAAVTAGDVGVDDSTDKDVCVDGGRGAGMWVARNMRYVWKEERIKRVDSGSRGRPSRRVSDGVTNAYKLLARIAARAVVVQTLV